MEVKLIIRCLALIYLSFNYTDSLTVVKTTQEPLKSDKPEEFVNETEKAVKEVNHIRKITDKMNRYLSTHTVDGNMFCEGKLDTCRTILDRYVSRCKSGDCYSIDPVTVFSVPDKFEIVLPHLAQYELAKYVFNQSGARNSGWDRFADLFKKEKSKNSLVEFNNEILRRNLSRVSSDNNNYLLLNEVLYSSTIYYQKYLNENRFHSARINRSRFLRTFFKLKHRSPLVKLVKDMVGEKTIGISHSDLKSLMDSVALYLSVGNYRPRPKVTVVFSKMVKHAIAVSLGYRKISFLMAEYLLTHPMDPNKYCKGNADVTCKQSVTSYMERCDEGDCTTMDTVDLLDPKDWLNVKLPQLAEVSLSFDLFNGSKAKKPHWIKLILEFNRNRMTLVEFKDTLYNRNAANVSYKTKNQGMLHRYLYKAALEFVWRARKFSMKNKLSDSMPTMMKFMSSVLGRDQLFLEIPKVRNVFIQFRNYLFKSGMTVSLSSVNKFAQDNQHVVFSYLHDPHAGEYSDRYAAEWKQLRDKELQKAQTELSASAGLPAPVEKVQSKYNFSNLWGLIPEKKPVNQPIKPVQPVSESNAESNSESKAESNSESNVESNEPTKEELKEQVREEMKEEVKEQVKQEVKQEVDKAENNLEAKIKNTFDDFKNLLDQPSSKPAEVQS